MPIHCIGTYNSIALTYQSECSTPDLICARVTDSVRFNTCAREMILSSLIFAERKDARLDVAILADNSEGLSSSDLDSLKAFVKDLISSLNVTSGDVRVALVVFTHEVFIDFYLGNFTGQPDSITQMINVIDSAPTRSGGTETG